MPGVTRPSAFGTPEAGRLLSSAAAASTPGWLVPSWYSLNGTSRSRACQYTSAASAARSALASAGAAGMAICVGVMPREADRQRADGVAQPTRSAERDLLEVGRVARLAGIEQGLPCRLIHLAARVVGQRPRVGADPGGVPRLVIVAEVRGEGTSTMVRAQACRTSRARRTSAPSMGRAGGWTAVGWAAAGAIGDMLAGASAAPTARPAPPRSPRRGSVGPEDLARDRGAATSDVVG